MSSLKIKWFCVSVSGYCVFLARSLLSVFTVSTVCGLFSSRLIVKRLFWKCDIVAVKRLFWKCDIVAVKRLFWKCDIVALRVGTGRAVRCHVSSCSI